MKYFQFILLFALPLCAFKATHKQTIPGQPAMYFPPNNSEEWDKTTVSSLGWNENAVQPLLDYLKNKRTKSFIILVNGRIVMEEYFNGQTQSDIWEWNSAGKTLVSETIGIAQQEGFLNINDKVSDYLGQHWSNEPIEKENLITIRNLLSMTSGLDDSRQLVVKRNLTYTADAGTRWAYANVFQLLMKIIDKATGQNFEKYFNTKIAQKTGMKGYWKNGLIFRIYHSDARSMARFGLLALNKGSWNGEQIIPENYFNQSIQSSQNINPSYGYLWWLNGKSSYMLPRSQKHFKGNLIPNAPANLYAAE